MTAKAPKIPPTIAGILEELEPDLDLVVADCASPVGIMTPPVTDMTCPLDRVVGTTLWTTFPAVIVPPAPSTLPGAEFEMT